MERNLGKNPKEKVKKVKKIDNDLKNSLETSSGNAVKKEERRLEAIDLSVENSDRVLPMGYADVYSSWSMD